MCNAVYCDFKIKIYNIDSKLFLLARQYDVVVWACFKVVRYSVNDIGNKEELWY